MGYDGPGAWSLLSGSYHKQELLVRVSPDIRHFGIAPCTERLSYLLLWRFKFAARFGKKKTPKRLSQRIRPVQNQCFPGPKQRLGGDV